MTIPERTSGSEGGAAALAIPIAAVLLMVVGLFLGDLGAITITRARAQTAADAAALAAAVEIALGGPAPPLEQARRLATANGARLVACRCPDRSEAPGPGRARPRSGMVLVEVDMPLRLRLLPHAVRIPVDARADVRQPGR